jgi:predicted methyltransferase
MRVIINPPSAAAGLICLLAGTTVLCAAEPIDFGARIVAAPDRDGQDRENDQWRHPAQFLDFCGVKPGMTVLDMLPIDGYTTELLARAVGVGGRVYAEIPPGSGKERSVALIERMARPAMANVELAETPVDAPVPHGVLTLDLVTLIWNSDNMAEMPQNRTMMNKALYEGLTEGGTLVIIDFAARAGASGASPRSLDRSTIIAELEAVGFKKQADGTFLQTANDPRDQPYGIMENTADQFALKFRKP